MDRNEPVERQDVRVPVFFPLMWCVAEDPHSLALEIEHHRTCDRFSTPPTAFTDLPTDLRELTEFKEMSPHIYAMWMSLERKIDRVISLVDKKTYNDPDMEKGVCTDLSAGGASIRVTGELNVGDVLQVRMSPPTFPPMLVEVAAEVKVCNKVDGRDGEWLVSTSFIKINHSDREDLVMYIFKRQREILRVQSE